jgi:hypothetical protein
LLGLDCADLLLAITSLPGAETLFLRESDTCDDLTTGLAFGATTGLAFGLAFGLALGLAFGLVLGLNTGLASASGLATLGFRGA